MDRDKSMLLDAARWWFAGQEDLDSALEQWVEAGTTALFEKEQEMNNPPALGVNVSDGTGTGERIG